MAKDFEQNDVSTMRHEGIDLSPRWQEILQEIIDETGFSPNLEEVRQSEWWKSGKIGAVSVDGQIKTSDGVKEVVLKVQGTRPATSEADMINEFAQQNKSTIIRPPRLYGHIPWKDEKQYEALLVEQVNGNPALTGHPAPQEELEMFFRLYIEYKINCINTPWIKRPMPGTYRSYRDRVTDWIQAVEEQRKSDKFGLPEDFELAQEAIEIIESNVSIDNLEFMHGHVAAGDFVVVSENEVVLFSNLFWSWRPPFYDIVFGYHWWILGEERDDLTEELLERERKRWLDSIFDLPIVKGNERLVNLALLERAVPALMVDRFMNDQSRPSAEIITKGARRDLKRLISIFKS